MRESALILICVVGVASVVHVSPVAAQQRTDVSACRIEMDRQRTIEACSRVIADATLPASIRADALVTRALIYSFLSATDFTTAIEIDPANPAVRKRRGHHYFASGRFDQAVTDYQEAIRLDPNDAEAYHGRGDAWLMQKRYSEAIADYRRSLELKPVASSTGWGQCRASASWTSAFFHCTQVADDTSQPAEVRAEAQRRLDGMMGRSGTAR
jgi:tetratricopeptide (TPR) repeat protein